MATGYGLSPLSAWDSKRFFDAPSAIQPLQNRQRCHRQFLGPVLSDHSSAVERQISILSCVSILLRSGSPSTVLRMVMAFIVNTIDTVLSRWARPHVGVECRKVIAPSVADANATIAIESERLAVHVVASAFHFSPCLMFSGFAKAMFRSMNWHFPAPTSTASSVMASKTSSANHNQSSAVALAFPISTLITAQDSQTAKSMSIESQHQFSYYHEGWTK